MVHPVEELLQVHVGYPAPARLDVALRRPHRLVRAAPRSKAVAVLGERRVELRLQHLEQALLDEPVHHRRDTECPRSPTGFGDLLPFHRLRLVAPREQLLPDGLPMRYQVRRQVVHGHPVHAGTALVLLHPFQRRERVHACDHLLHQPVITS